MARNKQYIKNQTELFKMSRSKVQLFTECPKCFYLDTRLGVGRLGSLPFTLNNAVDALLKNEFDEYRLKQEPHPYFISNNIDAVPYQHEKLNEWRENFKGIHYHHERLGFNLTGAIDDLWIDNKTQKIIVADYKATAKESEVTLDADWQQGYRNQMGFYQYILRGIGFDVDETGWFVYANGIKTNKRFDNQLKFDVSMIPYKADTSWIEPTLEDIKQCLESDVIPEQHEDCKYCNYVAKYGSALKH